MQSFTSWIIQPTRCNLSSASLCTTIHPTDINIALEYKTFVYKLQEGFKQRRLLTFFEKRFCFGSCVKLLEPNHYRSMIKHYNLMDGWQICELENIKGSILGVSYIIHMGSVEVFSNTERLVDTSFMYEKYNWPLIIIYWSLQKYLDWYYPHFGNIIQCHFLNMEMVSSALKRVFILCSGV